VDEPVTVDGTVGIVGNVNLNEPVSVDGTVSIGGTVDVAVTGQPVSVSVSTMPPTNYIDLIVSGAISQREVLLNSSVPGDLRIGHIFVTRITCQDNTNGTVDNLVRVNRKGIAFSDRSTIDTMLLIAGVRDTHGLSLPFYIDNTNDDQEIEVISQFGLGTCTVTYLYKP
jgi:hypothetical protein